MQTIKLQVDGQEFSHRLGDLDTLTLGMQFVLNEDEFAEYAKSPMDGLAGLRDKWQEEASRLQGEDLSPEEAADNIWQERVMSAIMGRLNDDEYRTKLAREVAIRFPRLKEAGYVSYDPDLGIGRLNMDINDLSNMISTLLTQGQKAFQVVEDAPPEVNPEPPKVKVKPPEMAPATMPVAPQNTNSVVAYQPIATPPVTMQPVGMKSAILANSDPFGDD